MDFGIMNLFPASEGEDDGRVMRQCLEEIVLADELGFDCVWLAEHHFSRYGILGSPLMFGMAVAERTKRIKIGTAVLVLPFYDPIRLAEDIAALDVMSEGRVVIGVGRGYQPKEYAGFRVDRETSMERYGEVLAVVRLALSEENWSFDGDFFKYEDMTTYPRPFQKGGPPIHQGAASPDGFRYLGSRGERIITSPSFTPLERIRNNFDIYREALTEAGKDASDYAVPFMQQVWCGRDEDGLRAVGQAALNYYRMVGEVIPGSAEAIENERRYYEAVKRNIDLLTVEQTLTYGGNFGSPEKVAETIDALRRGLGLSQYISWFRIPTLERNAALKSMEVFMSEVVPMLRELEVAA
jgi:alkanesulfonate monooxygenase SsuD/methylene tetrahydromethanopterin reductase-like flavin-dependent oxidoreductase (luciferase family)